MGEVFKLNHCYEYFASSWRSDVADTKIVCKEGYTIHVYFLMAGGRVPTREECTGMQEYFDTVKRPMGDLVLCHAPEEIPYDIELTYFGNSSSGNSKRIAYNGSSAAIWWLRSPGTSNNYSVWGVNTDGSYFSNWYNYSYGVRPAFILPSTLVVSDDGTVSVNTAPIAVLRGYTPDWLDWAINERTLDWIVQLVFDFTKKKLEDYMAKKSVETTTVARFGKAGEDKRND